jgi:hypothetical protein
MDKNRILRWAPLPDKLAQPVQPGGDHTEAQFYRSRDYVDAAGIGGKPGPLPGEAPGATCSSAEKSAEAIVSNSNGPREKGGDRRIPTNYRKDRLKK